MYVVCSVNFFSLASLPMFIIIRNSEDIPLLLSVFIGHEIMKNTNWFHSLFLQSAKSYFIHLRATNGAGLNVNTTSPPILVDLTDPTFGKVKDGADFSEDVDYQSSTSELTGNIYKSF